MRRYKIYLVVVLSFLILFAMANLFVWKIYVENLLNPRENQVVGDLARVGYVLDVAIWKGRLVDLPRTHIEACDFKGEDVDLLTIGDSFSNGGGGGKNSYYQDYISSKNNITVLNLCRYKKENTLNTLIILLNSGWFDKYRVKNVLIETAERFCIPEFTGIIDFDKSDSLENIENYLKHYKWENKPPDLNFINTGNFKFLLFNIFFNRAGKLKNGTVTPSGIVLRELSKDYFNSTKGKKFLCYIMDIQHISLCNDQSIVKLNNNLNIISGILRSKGIKLYFMPMVDKYNYYADYIVNNHYPKSHLFEKLRNVKKEYQYIDTKGLLSGLLKDNHKDVFWQDDSHCTFVAWKKIFDSIKFDYPAKIQAARIKANLP
jgi:hypothetical protein